jgi:hypothetical protein
MFATTSKTALTIAAVGALALPGAAQADTDASASAAAQASASAELHLDGAADLADSTSAAAQATARTLVSRSRGDLKTAVKHTRTLLASATTPDELDAAARIAIQVNTTLRGDANLLSRIAIESKGRLEGQAARALISDIRMQKALIAATLKTAGEQIGDDAQTALEAGADAVEALTAEVTVAADTAASANVAGRARASADMAVAIGTDALSTSADALTTIKAETATTAQDATQRLRDGLVDAAARIASAVGNTGIDEHRVKLGGHGLIRLGKLADIGVEITGSATVPGLGANTSSSVDVATLMGLRS